MKILFVCKSLPMRYQGGIQTHVWKLSEHLISLGHEVSILTAGRFRGGEKRYTFVGRNIIEIPYLPLYKQPIMPIFLEEYSFNISAKKWLNKHNSHFDIIHLQGRSGFMFPSKKHEKPIVTTLHGLITIENKRSKKQRTIEVAWHEKWADFYEKNELKNADALIAVSQEMLDEMINIWPDAYYKTAIIPNGVDIKEPQEVIETDNKQLVFVGRLDPIKGVHNLVKAMKIVDKHIHLVMIGDGSERAFLEKYIATEGLGNRIKLTGSLPNDDVFTWINKSFALILPSFHETQGIVLLEANACNKPVLASNVGGITEVVEHRKNGLLFNPNDVDDMANAINTLFRNPIEAQRMGENGRKIVEERFTWRSIAIKTIDFYKKSINTFYGIENDEIIEEKTHIDHHPNNNNEKAEFLTLR